MGEKVTRKHIAKGRSVTYLFPIIILSLLGCHFNHHESSKEKYKKLTENNSAIVEVKEISNKDDFVHWHTDSKEKFLVKKVWSDTKEQSCKNCHQGYPLKEIQGKVHPRSHWDIQLKHATSQVMNCKTCHNPNKVWLFNFGQQTVNANYTAKLCLKCHFKQEKDWELGAHGKRTHGWKYEKSIYNCTFCHNPHDPSFKKRWPKIDPFRPIFDKER